MSFNVGGAVVNFTIFNTHILLQSRLVEDHHHLN
jgi:hypothetical protein